jgi:hypothetical protein
MTCLEKPSGAAVTQPISKLYVTVFAYDSEALAANRSSKGLNIVLADVELLLGLIERYLRT